MKTPMLVARGYDLYHPASVSEEAARLAPHARLLERWKEVDAVEAIQRGILCFPESARP